MSELLPVVLPAGAPTYHQRLAGKRMTGFSTFTDPKNTQEGLIEKRQQAEAAALLRCVF